MKKKLIFLAYIIIFSALGFSANLYIVKAQKSNLALSSIMFNADTNGNSSSTSSSLQFVGRSNFSELTKNYETTKRLEAGPPQRVVDKEAPLDKFINEDQLKKNLQRFEGTIPSAGKLSFNSHDILRPNATHLNLTKASVSNSLTKIDVRNLTQARSTLTKTSFQNTIANSWKGLDILQASRRFLGEPPDVTMAVGPNHILQVVHSAIKIWDKNGQNSNTTFLDDFWKKDEYHSLSDPVVYYDQSVDRWFSAIMEISPSPDGERTCVYDCFIDVGVSVNNDPNTSWNIFRVPFKENVPDYPMIGLSRDKLALGVNVFGDGMKGYLGAQAVIIDKNKMLQNNTLPSFSSSPFYKNYYTIYPVTSFNHECILMEANNWPNHNITHTDGVILFNICGNPSTNNVKINAINIPILRSYIPPVGVQPNNVGIETDLNKIRGPVYYNNTVISAFNILCENDAGTRHSCIRILKIVLNTTNYPTIQNQSFVKSIDIRDFSSNDADVFYPSLSVNKQGNIVMVFGLSNEHIYPSGLVAILDQDLNKKEIFAIVQGTANTYITLDDQRPRFGDYFTSSTDPKNGSVWVTGEYGEKNIPNDKNKWSTFIANIS